MQKIKLMLSVIAVVAVVGGALAFKAKGKTMYCSTVSGGVADTRDCPKFNNSTFTAAGLLDPVISYCTALAGNAQSTCAISVKQTGAED